MLTLTPSGEYEVSFAVAEGPELRFSLDEYLALGAGESTEAGLVAAMFAFRRKARAAYASKQSGILGLLGGRLT